MSAAIILSLQTKPESSLLASSPISVDTSQEGDMALLNWWSVTDSSEQLTGQLEDFEHWLEKQNMVFNLYLLLPRQALSFHQVEVPAGVKRSAQQLIPVLVEEQLAQDLDQVQIHYTGQDVDLEESGVNVAVCDRTWFEQLQEVFKSSKVRLQACLPDMICSQDHKTNGAIVNDNILANLPAPTEQDYIQWPAELSIQNEESVRFFNQLKQSNWNMVIPERAQLGELGWIVIGCFAAAGLHLLNLYLAG